MKKFCLFALIGLCFCLITAGCGGSGGSNPINSPSIPTNLKAVGAYSQITLTWSGVIGAFGYKIYYGTTSKSYTTSVSSSANSCTVTGLANGTTYYFVVAAVNSTGISGYSTEVSAIPAYFTRQFGTSEADNATGIAMDSKGDFYLSGHTYGSFNNYTNAGGEDAFLAKYDKNGDFIWVRQFGTPAYDIPKTVTADNYGNVYIAGYTEGSLGNSTNAGGNDAFLAKFDSIGNLVWLKEFGTNNYDGITKIVTDNKGNIYLSGITSGSLSGNTNFGKTDAFFAKYNNNGELIWLKQIGTSDEDGANGIILDSNDNIILTGFTAGALGAGNADPDYLDAFVGKYDNNGNLIWLKQFGSAQSDETTGVTLDNSGNIYLCGYTLGIFDGNVGKGKVDAFITKYNSSGNLLWLKQFGTSNDDRTAGISTDSSGNAYISGCILSVSYNNDDAFIAKYDSTGNSLWLKQIGTPSNDQANDIIAASSGKVYICGRTEGSFDANVSPWIENAFIAQYDGNGNKY